MENLNFSFFISVGFLFFSIILFAYCYFYLKKNQPNIIDLVWSFNIALGAFFALIVLEGYAKRKMLICWPIIIWGARLTYYQWIRLQKIGHDKRYETLMQEWGSDVKKKFFSFFSIQGVTNIVLMMPVFFTASNKARGLHWFEISAGFIIMIAIIGEAMADYQLFQFKKDPANQGKLFDRGLWKKSRHPNYFFEMMFWVGQFLLASASPWGVLSILAPAMMIYLIYNITGVPATEKQVLSSKGDAYRAYMERTNMFFPFR